MNPTELGLARVFAAARRRLRAAWILATGELTLPVIGAAALGLVLVGWLIPWRWPEPAALVVSVGSALLVVGYGLLFRVSDFKVARALDRGLDSHDAVTSALEVDPASPFSARMYQQVDGLTTADASNAIKLRFNYKPFLLGGVLLVAAVVFAVVRNPADDDRDRLAREQLAIEEVGEDVEALAEQLAEDPATAELAEDLEALAADVSRADDLSEALEKLEQSTAELEARTDAESLSKRAASLGLSRTLAANPVPASGPPRSTFAEPSSCWPIPARSLRSVASGVRTR